MQKVRHAIKIIDSRIKRLVYRQAFYPLNFKRARAMSYSSRRPAEFPQFLKSHLESLDSGGYLIKLHFTSKGKRKQFFRVSNGNELRWSDSEKKIGKPKANHVCKRRE